MSVDLGVLVSGSGTNLQAILDAIAGGRLDARVRLVVSNQPGVRALERAERAGVPHVVISHRAKPSREAFDSELVQALRNAGADWIVLAGFMRVLTPVFLDAFAGRIINIHPALLPSFPGTHALRQALEHGVKITGCTVHYIDTGVDTGRIIAQRAVPILPGDDEASLGERVHPAEHELLVEVLAEIAAGKLGPFSPPQGPRA
ncbi:MAG TPA: phosphoribosylglycinamide formyltransferase [Polyangiaceae bacterium]|nr:phosphoribosylglycinamide formyltransferase [Polyangiaceae bacterium]